MGFSANIHYMYKYQGFNTFIEEARIVIVDYMLLLDFKGKLKVQYFRFLCFHKCFAKTKANRFYMKCIISYSVII